MSETRDLSSTGPKDNQSAIANRQSAILISVSDTGIGIAKEHQSKLFTEFYQVNGGAKGKTPGTGLGLSLVKRMVEQHGGRVWMESDSEGKGSKFRFTIPLSPAEGLVQAIGVHLVQRGKETRGFALILFTLDGDAINQASSAVEKGKGVTTNDVWAALAENTKALGFKSAFSGNEFIVTAAVDNGVEAVVRETLRRLLKDVLFQKVPSAVTAFSCGMAKWTAETTAADGLLAAARKSQVTERDRIAAKCIVVVDDEESVRDIVRRQLKRFSFENAGEASGGEKLFTLLQCQTPDLILLDIYMPGMNGYEVIGRLKGHTQTAQIPILIMSGRDVDSTELRQRSPTTAIHVLEKPVRLDELNKYVSYLL